MAKNQKALKRYRVILRVLARPGGHSSQNIQLACINSGIEVKLRTIQKDLEDLRDDHTIFGVTLKIVYDHKERKWKCEEIPKELFSTIELEDGEVDALLFYAKTVNQYRDYPFFDKINRAIKKVIDGSNLSMELRSLFLTEGYLQSERHHSIQGIELITQILLAIHNRRVLEIRYQKFSGDKIKLHRIRPILLKEDKHFWYIIGESQYKGSIITLALDRIRFLQETREEFDVIAFDQENYFKYSFGVTVTDQKPVNVIIRFSAYQGNYIKTLPLHSTQKILQDSTEGLIISVKIKPSYEFYSKILSYGPDASIISPKGVREEIYSYIKASVEMYK